MNLDLSKFPEARQLLSSYEFIFSQWIGGQMSDEEILSIVPTVYIFGEIVSELRRQYLERPDSDIKKLEKVEQETIKKVAAFAGFSEEKLQEIFKSMMGELRKNIQDYNQEKGLA